MFIKNTYTWKNKNKIQILHIIKLRHGTTKWAHPRAISFAFYCRLLLLWCRKLNIFGLALLAFYCELLFSWCTKLKNIGLASLAFHCGLLLSSCRKLKNLGSVRSHFFMNYSYRDAERKDKKFQARFARLSLRINLALKRKQKIQKRAVLVPLSSLLLFHFIHSSLPS